jgi:hypothetical protein
MGIQTISPEELLKLHRINSAKEFMIGVFHSNITIYRQQILALNIVYAMLEAKIANTTSKVLIVGAGVAGITAALALHKKGVSVDILEKSDVLIPIQYSCDIRPVHPFIADWPEDWSLNPYTDLPFLNWSYASASKVCEKISSEFNSYLIPENDNLNLYTRSNERKFRCDMNKTLYNVSFEAQKNSSDAVMPWHKDYHIILYATGFGTEESDLIKGKGSKSYWRNDDYSQKRIGKQLTQFLVTGTGDGGITDICRITLESFSQVKIAHEFSKIGDGNLYDKLKLIKTAFNNKRSDSLWDSFENVFQSNERELKAFISKKRRADIKRVILNGTGNFTSILNLNNLSFINCWMCFLLYKLKIIEYDVNRLDREQLKGALYKNHEIIIRHGAKRESHLEGFIRNKDTVTTEIKAFKKSQLESNLTITPIWTELEYWEDWSPSETTIKRSIPGELLGMAETLVQSISSSINNVTSSEPNFRIVLHRLYYFNNEIFFQQISNYAGLPDAGERGRIFRLQNGYVGKCFMTSKALMFKSLVTEQQLARKLRKSAKSAFCVPLLFDKIKHPLFVLYCDFNNRKLINSLEIRKLIYSGADGFANSLSRMVNDDIMLGIGQISRTTFAAVKSKRINTQTTEKDMTSEYESFYKKDRKTIPPDGLINFVINE